MRIAKAFDESKHPRQPKGSPKGGEFSGDTLDFYSDPEAWPPPSDTPGDYWQRRVHDVMDYHGQSTREVDFNRRLDQKLVPSELKKSWRDAAEAYAGHEDDDMEADNSMAASWNRQLRDSGVVHDREEINALRDAITHGPKLTKESVLFRGVGGTLNVSEGDLIEDKGFASTSSSYMVASDFGHNMLIIRAPAGTPVFPIHMLSGHDQEQEFLLAPGSKMRVRRVEERSGEFTSKRLVFVDLE